MSHDHAMALNAGHKQDRQRAGTSVVWFVLCCMTAAAGAQAGAPPQETNAAAKGLQMVNGQTVGSISGMVADSDGALVAGAQVTLTSAAIKGTRTDVTDSAGHFHFAGVG